MLLVAGQLRRKGGSRLRNEIWTWQAPCAAGLRHVSGADSPQHDLLPKSSRVAWKWLLVVMTVLGVHLAEHVCGCGVTDTSD